MVNKNITASNLLVMINELAAEYPDKYGHHIKKNGFSNDNGTLRKTESKLTQLVPKDNDFTQISKGVFLNREVNELKVLARIINDLRSNNPLWYCNDRESKQVKDALANLVKLQIISYIVGSKGFYIINPLYIRKGNTFQIYPALSMHFHNEKKKNKAWKLSVKDIIDLKFDKDYSLFLPNF